MPASKAFLVAILLPLSLCGCVVSGGVDALVDDTIQTGSIKASPAGAETGQLSDQRMVRNAVSAADISRGETHPVNWANADTGARGVITAIREERQGSRICRSFTTSRQRFDGIALYDGEACTRGDGQWTLTRFAESG